METLFKKSNDILLIKNNANEYDPVSYARLLLLFEISEMRSRQLEQIIEEIIACFDDVESKDQLIFDLVAVLHKHSLIDYEGD